MPSKEAIRRYHRRKRTAMRVRSKARPKVYLPIGGFPARLMVKLRYCQTFALNPGAGTLVQQNFRANSLFDPDSTGVGHQPSNYDRLTELYDRYTVVSSKIKICDVGVTTSGISNGLLAIMLSEAGTDLATAHGAGGVDNVCEQPRLKRALKNFSSHQNSGPNSWSLTFSAKKFFGVGKIVGEEPYTADVAANPAEQAFFEVGYMSPNDSLDPGTKTFRAEIEYIAVMTEPKVADAS